MDEPRTEWDEWNERHIGRHGVLKEEVDQACRSAAVALQGHSGRTILVGVTDAGRLISVIVAQIAVGPVYYPVTARPASVKERRLYRAARGADHE